MTIDELIERLEEYRDTLGGDAEVRLMTQQNWPFENEIVGLASGEEINGRDDDGRRGRRRRPRRLHRRGPAALLRIEARLGGRVLKPKRPRGRRGGWFPPPDDGSQTIAIDDWEKNDDYAEDRVPPRRPKAGRRPSLVRSRSSERPATRSPSTPRAADSSEAKATKKSKATPKEKRLSAIDAAAKVLTEASEPMNAKQLIDAIVTKGYWTSPAGKTPHATLYSAILREIKAKGSDARFAKADRGKFAAKTKESRR